MLANFLSHYCKLRRTFCRDPVAPMILWSDSSAEHWHVLQQKENMLIYRLCVRSLCIEDEQLLPLVIKALFYCVDGIFFFYVWWKIWRFRPCWSDLKIKWEILNGINLKCLKPLKKQIVDSAKFLYDVLQCKVAALHEDLIIFANHVEMIVSNSLYLPQWLEDKLSTHWQGFSKWLVLIYFFFLNLLLFDRFKLSHQLYMEAYSKLSEWDTNQSHHMPCGGSKFGSDHLWMKKANGTKEGN